MFDKEYTIKLVSKVLKQDIIPSINNEVAKEQAIAMLSVLKNVNLNTVQNVKPYEEVNELLQTKLTSLLERVIVHIEDTENNQVHSFLKQLEQLKTLDDVRLRWEESNALFSKIIKYLYHSKNNLEEYIQECRKILREQLDIEMRLVG